MEKFRKVKWWIGSETGTGVYVGEEDIQFHGFLVIRDDNSGWDWNESRKVENPLMNIKVGTENCYWVERVEPIEEPAYGTSWSFPSLCINPSSGIYLDYSYRDSFSIVYGGTITGSTINQTFGEQNNPGVTKMKINSMMKRLLDAKTKKLIKADILDGDLLLTPKGRGVLDAIIFEEYKDKLVAEAEEIIKDDK